MKKKSFCRHIKAKDESQNITSKDSIIYTLFSSFKKKKKTESEFRNQTKWFSNIRNKLD